MNYSYAVRWAIDNEPYHASGMLINDGQAITSKEGFSQVLDVVQKINKIPDGIGFTLLSLVPMVPDPPPAIPNLFSELSKFKVCQELCTERGIDYVINVNSISINERMGAGTITFSTLGELVHYLTRSIFGIQD